MKTLFLLTFLTLCSQIVSGQENDKNLYALKLELLKPLSWIQTGSYIMEPEFSIHHREWAFNFTAGYSEINAPEIYRQLEYTNKGWYGQIGAQYQAIKFQSSIAGLYFGINVNLANYEETGTIVFEGDYFDDYTAVLTQNNTTWGVNWLTTAKFVLSERVFTDLTARISKAINPYNEPHYPVYYVPGLGVMNFLENRRKAFRTTIGFSVKLGIILNDIHH